MRSKRDEIWEARQRQRATRQAGVRPPPKVKPNTGAGGGPLPGMMASAPAGGPFQGGAPRPQMPSQSNLGNDGPMPAQMMASAPQQGRGGFQDSGPPMMSSGPQLGRFQGAETGESFPPRMMPRGAPPPPRPGENPEFDRRVAEMMKRRQAEQTGGGGGFAPNIGRAPPKPGENPEFDRRVAEMMQKQEPRGGFGHPIQPPQNLAPSGFEADVESEMRMLEEVMKKKALIEAGVIPAAPRPNAPGTLQVPSMVTEASPGQLQRRTSSQRLDSKGMSGVLGSPGNIASLPRQESFGRNQGGLFSQDKVPRRADKQKAYAAELQQQIEETNRRKAQERRGSQPQNGAQTGLLIGGDQSSPSRPPLSARRAGTPKSLEYKRMLDEQQMENNRLKEESYRQQFSEQRPSPHGNSMNGRYDNAGPPSNYNHSSQPPGGGMVGAMGSPGGQPRRRCNLNELHTGQDPQKTEQQRKKDEYRQALKQQMLEDEARKKQKKKEQEEYDKKFDVANQQQQSSPNKQQPEAPSFQAAPVAPDSMSSSLRQVAPEGSSRMHPYPMEGAPGQGLMGNPSGPSIGYGDPRMEQGPPQMRFGDPRVENMAGPPQHLGMGRMPPHMQGEAHPHLSIPGLGPAPGPGAGPDSLPSNSVYGPGPGSLPSNSVYGNPDAAMLGGQNADSMYGGMRGQYPGQGPSMGMQEPPQMYGNPGFKDSMYQPPDYHDQRGPNPGFQNSGQPYMPEPMPLPPDYQGQGPGGYQQAESQYSKGGPGGGFAGELSPGGAHAARQKLLADVYNTGSKLGFAVGGGGGGPVGNPSQPQGQAAGPDPSSGAVGPGMGSPGGAQAGHARHGFNSFDPNFQEAQAAKQRAVLQQKAILQQQMEEVRKRKEEEKAKKKQEQEEELREYMEAKRKEDEEKEAARIKAQMEAQQREMDKQRAQELARQRQIEQEQQKAMEKAQQNAMNPPAAPPFGAQGAGPGLNEGVIPSPIDRNNPSRKQSYVDPIDNMPVGGGPPPMFGQGQNAAQAPPQPAYVDPINEMPVGQGATASAPPLAMGGGMGAGSPVQIEKPKPKKGARELYSPPRALPQAKLASNPIDDMPVGAGAAMAPPAAREPPRETRIHSAFGMNSSRVGSNYQTSPIDASPVGFASPGNFTAQGGARPETEEQQQRLFHPPPLDPSALSARVDRLSDAGTHSERLNRSPITSPNRRRPRSQPPDAAPDVPILPKGNFRVRPPFATDGSSPYSGKRGGSGNRYGNRQGEDLEESMGGDSHMTSVPRNNISRGGGFANSAFNNLSNQNSEGNIFEMDEMESFVQSWQNKHSMARNLSKGSVGDLLQQKSPYYPRPDTSGGLEESMAGVSKMVEDLGMRTWRGPMGEQHTSSRGSLRSAGQRPKSKASPAPPPTVEQSLGGESMMMYLQPKEAKEPLSAITEDDQNHHNDTSPRPDAKSPGHLEPSAFFQNQEAIRQLAPSPLSRLVESHPDVRPSTSKEDQQNLSAPSPMEDSDYYEEDFEPDEDEVIVVPSFGKDTPEKAKISRGGSGLFRVHTPSNAQREIIAQSRRGSSRSESRRKNEVI